MTESLQEQALKKGGMPKRPYKVLIAQQGTVTPYRVALYELMVQHRPADWTFTVVNDVDRRQRHDYYKGAAAGRAGFRFSTLPARSRLLTFMGRSLMWQSFFLKAREAVQNFEAPGFREQIFSTVSHLTIRQMASRFIGTINPVLGVSSGQAE